MITKEQLESMNIGDTFKAGPLLPGVCDEPVMLRLSEAGNGDYVFAMSYQGIAMGEVAVMIRGGQTTVEHL